MIEGPRILLIVFIALYYKYIYNGKTPISKEQNDSIPTLDGQTLSISRFDFENLTQSEARELPTSGHESVMECPRILLIVFIALYYTYTMAKHQYLSNRMTAYHYDGLTLSNSRFDFENLTQSEAREPPTSGHKNVMEGPTMVLIVSIGLLYTYT